jgi:aspartate aminotransferase
VTVENTRTNLDFASAGSVDGSLSDRVRGLRGSEILVIAAQIRELIAGGGTVCNLTVGDFDPAQFPIPAGLLGGLQQALARGETNYPPSNGMPALRQAVGRYVAREWNVVYPVESILIASGARPILYSAYRCVINPGDKVVYPVPSWNNNHYTWISGAEGVVVPTLPEDGFMPTLDGVAPHLADARLLCINSPLNPAGTVIGEEQLRRIVGAVVEENHRRTRQGRRHLFLLFDQVYASLVFGEARHHMPAQLVPEAAPWVITLDGISKSLAATGLRVGWVLAAPELIERMNNLVGHIGAWAPRAEQVALAAFLDAAAAAREFQSEMNRSVQLRLDALYDGFASMKRDGYPVDCIAPQGAIYLSLRLDLIGRSLNGTTIDSNEAIRRLLLERAGLAIIPFQAFGLDEDTGWFRLSVGAVSPDAIEEAFPRLRDLLDGFR